MRWAIINKSNKKIATEGDAQTSFRGKISSLQAAVGHHSSWINATYTNQIGCNLSAKNASATAIIKKIGTQTNCTMKSNGGRKGKASPSNIGIN